MVQKLYGSMVAIGNEHRAFLKMAGTTGPH
jgi:hypothetical protein